MQIDYANAHGDAFSMLCKTCRVLRIIGELDSNDESESVGLLTDYSGIPFGLSSLQELQKLYLSHFDLTIEQNALDVVSAFSLVPDDFKDESLVKRPTSFHEFVYWKFAQVFSNLDDAFRQLESRFPEAFDELESWTQQTLRLDKKQMMVLKQLFYEAFSSGFFVDFAIIKEGLESERRAAIRSSNGLTRRAKKRGFKSDEDRGAPVKCDPAHKALVKKRLDDKKKKAEKRLTSSVTSSTGGKKQASKSDKGRGAPVQYDQGHRNLVRNKLDEVRKKNGKKRLTKNEKYDAITESDGFDFITKNLAEEEVSDFETVVRIIDAYAR